MKRLLLIIILALSIFSNACAESGWQGDQASDIKTDTLPFDNNLSSLDDNVQKALETLDAKVIVSAEADPLSLHYFSGTVATAAATAAKEVTIAGYTPTAGDVLTITYTLGTSAASPTLAINGGSPISIRLGSTAASATTHTIGANGEAMYYYDGTDLQLFGSMRTSDADTMQAVYHNINKVAGVDITQYKIVMEGSDNKFYPLSVGNTTALTKVQSAMTFKPLGLILWYGTTPTVVADASFTSTFTEHTFSTATYTFNKTTSYTNYAPIFIVGTIDANGFFVLDQTDTTSWFTQTLPSTEDGKVYIRIGLLYNTTGAIHLETNHPLYEYKNGRVREMANYVLPTASDTVLGGVKIGDNLTIVDGVVSADADPADYLKLTQAPAQTLTGGKPTFAGGLRVPSTVGVVYFVDLSPIVYNALNYYLAGDAAVIFYFSPTEDFQIVMDSGSAAPIGIVGMADSQPTIYMYLVTALGGAHITCYSDLESAAFLTWFKAIAKDPDAVVDYTEVAFTFADGVYTNVTTKPVCDPSDTTIWTDPMTVGLFGGTIIGENIVSTTNYTNYNSASIFKTKGQIKAGNGALLDLVTAPLVVNQTYRDFSSDALNFAMTFVPQIGSITGTVGAPTYASLYIAGMYGTTIIDGAHARFNGIALGGWCAVQNALDTGGNVTLTEAVAMRAGMTYSSTTAENLVINNFSCYQTDFTNLNQGTSSHDNIYHYQARLLTDNVSAVTNNYAFYTSDNSLKATNSWGLYSLEPSNYARKLFLGATPTKPTKDLEVTGNASVVGDGTGIENAPLMVKQTTAYASPYNQYLQIWKSSDGTNIGHFRADGSMTVVNSKANGYQARTNGTETTPMFMSNDSKSGMWFPSGTGLGFSTNRTLRMSILTDGKIGIGMTPTELLDVNGNVKATGYKSGTETGQTTTVTVVTDVRDNAGQMEKKTQVLTFTSGLLTTQAAESAWTATTDI